VPDAASAAHTGRARQVGHAPSAASGRSNLAGRPVAKTPGCHSRGAARKSQTACWYHAGGRELRVAVAHVQVDGLVVVGPEPLERDAALPGRRRDRREPERDRHRPGAPRARRAQGAGSTPFPAAASSPPTGP